MLALHRHIGRDQSAGGAANVYVCALVFGGKPREFLERAREGEFELAVSEDIIAEVAHVLRDRFGWSAGDVGEAYDVIVECTRRVEPTERLTVITEDPDDDRILECALTARRSAGRSGGTRDCRRALRP